MFPNQSPHLPSTPVSHLLEKLRVPTAVFTADLKLSITQPASLVCPSILSPVEGAGLGATLLALFCLLQASIFLTPGSQTPPVLSCLASSSALMDASGWLGPRPPASLKSLQECPCCPPPHPAGPTLKARPLELSSGAQGMAGSRLRGLTVDHLSCPLPRPLPPGSSGSGFPVLL